MKRKIAIISEHASPLDVIGGIDSGGQNVYVDQIAKNLTKRDYTVDIFTRLDNPNLPKIVMYQHGVRVIHIKSGPKKFIPKEQMVRYTDEFYENMLAFIEQEEITYHIVHANFFISGEIARRFKKKLGIPFVITFHALGKVRRIHQGENDTFSDERFAIEENIIQEADQIIAECPQDREDLLYFYHADQNNISIIPCGFDPYEFYPVDKHVAKMKLGLDTRTTYLLQLGRMVPRKGVDTVLYALSLLEQKIKTPIKLLIVGGDLENPDPQKTPEIGRLSRLADSLGIKDHVIFAGRKSRDQLKYYYNAADVFISVPWYEPFGITPLEAMACGTPVIGSRVGGIQFSILDEKTGFLVPPKDPQALSEKIRAVLENEKLAKLFAENAKKRVQAFFTWDIITDALVKVYEKILYARTSAVEEYQLFTEIVDTNFDNLLHTVSNAKEKLRFSVARASRVLAKSLKNGGRVFACGNGGSAAHAQHLASELVGQYKIPKRSPLPVISLTTDTSLLTALGNDFSFDDIFSRQIDAHGQEGDTLVAISTSGNSENIIKALQKASAKNMICVGLTGKNGGKMIEYCDVSLIVPSNSTQHIQEIHTHVVHSLCELVELQLSQAKIKQGSIGKKVTGRKNGKVQTLINRQIKE